MGRIPAIWLQCSRTLSWFGRESPEERAASYSYQLPFAMVEVANKICEAIPGAIVDFDITEGERAVGLAFLEAGKFFAVNNGPYYYSFDDPEYAPGGGMGANVLVFPGLARAVNARHTLNYDKWIPSTLFLTHLFTRRSRVFTMDQYRFTDTGAKWDLGRFAQYFRSRS
jgi:hypothetical protein